MSKRHLDPTPFLVPPGRKIRLSDYDPGYTGPFKHKSQAKSALKEDVAALARAQELLWASATHSVIIIFQALDAAGKDSTIKHVMSGVNPQGVQVTSFKAPTEEEARRHFLWRPMQHLPGHGRIAIFNRSYYEEVLVVRVHPEFLQAQFPGRRFNPAELRRLWKTRYEEINQFEAMLTRNNVCLIKFFLHVSKAEQKERFLERLNNPAKHWKFCPGDLRERQHWKAYQRAYQDMLRATSTPDAPWHIVPADKKWFTRAVVADIITRRIEALDLHYPTLTPEQEAELAAARRELEPE